MAAKVNSSASVTVRGRSRIVVPAGRAGEAFANLIAIEWLEVETTLDFSTAIWTKACVNAVASLEALIGRPAGIFRNPDLQELALQLARECTAVALAEGARLGPCHAEEVIGYLAALPPDLAASILRDRMASRQLEWEALVGVVDRFGRRHAIPTPVASIVARLLAAASGEESPA